MYNVQRIRQRIRFKLAGFVFQSLVNLAPPHLADDCHLASSNRHLRSADTRTCVVPRTNTRFGDRSFSNSGPKIWNSLPSALRQPGLSFAMFKQHLKSYLFNATETEVLRDTCFYGRLINSFYVCMYVFIPTKRSKTLLHRLANSSNGLLLASVVWCHVVRTFKFHEFSEHDTTVCWSASNGGVEPYTYQRRVFDSPCATSLLKSI